jgi:hypothetical protein
MKAVRLAVLRFLPDLVGRNNLFQEDKQAACYVLIGHTSHSPEMIGELRRLWFLLDSNNIHIIPRYIISATNTLANKVGRHLECDGLYLDPSLFFRD